MYSTNTAVTMSLSDLLEKVDDITIYSYYLGDFKVGQLMKSPLRAKDDNPSFAVFRARNGNLLFKDHALGESGNALKFIKMYRGIETRDELERELLRILRKITPELQARVASNAKVVSSGLPADVGIVRQPFTKVDKEYWKQFHISLDTLKKFNVFSIKYYLCNRVVRGTYKDDNPMYAYKVFDKFKIYRPLASKYTKWRTNLTNRDVQGLAELPKEGGNLLIITKSLKDVMCLYEMGFYAIAAASETTFIPDDILQSLRSKWKKIVLIYDRDATGVKKAREYSKKYNIDAIFVHKKYDAKDISDAVKANGFLEIKQWLIKTLSN